MSNDDIINLLNNSKSGDKFSWISRDKNGNPWTNRVKSKEMIPEYITFRKHINEIYTFDLLLRNGDVDQIHIREKDLQYHIAGKYE